MNPRTLKKHIESVQQPWFWDFANDVLYALCRKHPNHTDHSVAAAKIWLIGRSYAAAIERRKPNEAEPKNFYRERVAPMVCNSEIDKHLASLKSFKAVTQDSLCEIVDTHKYVTDLFNQISGQNKRSLASKYLHFHAPQLFFIYDSVASKGLGRLSRITGRASRASGHGDNQYRKFAEKCVVLRDHIRNDHGVTLTTRQIDRLLLAVGRT